MDYLISENHLSLDIYHLWRDGMISNQAWEILKKTINRQPKLDAVEVTRCENCIYFKEDTEQGTEWGYCEYQGVSMSKFGFCSDAQRDEEEK